VYVATLEAKAPGGIHKILPQNSVPPVRATALRTVCCLKTGLTPFIQPAQVTWFCTVGSFYVEKGTEWY